MIVDINIKQLGIFAAELKKVIDECEEAEINVFNQLKDSLTNWQDKNSVVFEEEVKNEKKQTHDFLIALKKNKELYDFIYEEYKSIGNKLYFNLEKKDSIISAIDNSITKLDAVLNDFNKVDRSFYYYEISLIDSQKNTLEDVRKQLVSMKDKINNLYNRIIESEKRIASKISALDQININRFGFSFK